MPSELPERMSDADEAIVRALLDAPDWVTVELVVLTIKVWQPFYEEQLIPTDAVEIITNAGQLFDAISGSNDETIRGTGSGK